MSTNPIPPMPVDPEGSRTHPDNPDPDMPDIVDPGTEEQDVGTRPDDDSPLEQPATNPDAPDDAENPDDQLPRWSEDEQ